MVRLTHAAFVVLTTVAATACTAQAPATGTRMPGNTASTTSFPPPSPSSSNSTSSNTAGPTLFPPTPGMSEPVPGTVSHVYNGTNGTNGSSNVDLPLLPGKPTNGTATQAGISPEAVGTPKSAMPTPSAATSPATAAHSVDCVVAVGVVAASIGLTAF